MMTMVFMIIQQQDTASLEMTDMVVNLIVFKEVVCMLKVEGKNVEKEKSKEKGRNKKCRNEKYRKEKMSN